MHRIDTPSNTIAIPAALPQGTPGFFKDPDPGQKNGTEVSADWLNAIQEEVARVIEGLGGTLDKDDQGQLWTLVRERLTEDGRFSSSVVVGDPDGDHTLIGTLTIGANDYQHILTRIARITMGIDVGPAGAPKIILDGTTGMIDMDGPLLPAGDIHGSGQLRLGGNRHAGTGAKVTANGSTGDISANGDGAFGGAVSADKTVSAAKGVSVGYAEGTPNNDPVTINAASGSQMEFLVGGSVWTSGAIQTQTINCDKVGANSIVLVSVQAGDGSPTTYQPVSCGVREQAAGSFTIWARNDGADMTDPSIRWRFIVFNPV